MELGLSLGDPPKPFGFIAKQSDEINDDKSSAFCMDLSIGPLRPRTGEDNQRQHEPDELNLKEQQRRDENGKSGSSSSEPPVQLDLLPHAPVPRTHGGFSWSSPSTENHGEFIKTQIPKNQFILIFIFLI